MENPAAPQASKRTPRVRSRIPLSMQHAACSMQHARRSTGVDTRTNLLHGEMFQLFQGKRFGGEQPLGIAVNCILPVVQLRPQKGGVEWTLKFKFEARAIATVFATNAMSACTPTRLQAGCGCMQIYAHALYLHRRQQLQEMRRTEGGALACCRGRALTLCTVRAFELVQERDHGRRILLQRVEQVERDARSVGLLRPRASASCAKINQARRGTARSS